MGHDGVFRCFGGGDPLYARYHDEEWGVPVTGEHEMFERVCLEVFQSGLAWITILRKRDGFRRAFHDFEPAVVAAYTASDVDRLLGDEAIVRNRAKIEATVANARAVVALHDAGERLAEWVWSSAPTTERAASTSLSDLAPTTPESTALAKRLKAAGFRHVGPTTMHAVMEACGVVNDHLARCPARARVGALRERAVRSFAD
jgi:DNA-3-methyladenine glycosylase I